MSAPDTNIEKQKIRHKGPLVGMMLAVVVVLGLFAALISVTIDKADEATSTKAEMTE